MRYTACGDTVAEARVAQDLSRLSTGIDSELGEELRALLLTGPFARAEGGIVCVQGEPHAALPGYELIAVFRTRPERHERKLEDMAATWGRLLQTHVAIRAFSLHDLSHVAATRFWFHAGRGWLITLLGDPAVSLSIPRREPSDLRWQEGPIALCEGLTGLALSALDPNIAQFELIACMQRAVLACGDALLLGRGHYADTLTARAEALESMHASAALRAAFRDAIAWSARPDAWRPESGDVQSWIAATRRALADAVVHAQGEQLGSARDLLGYVRHPQPLFTAPRVRRRSAVQRVVRSFSLLSSAFENWRGDPIERLLRASAALALGPQLPECRAAAAELLGVPDGFAPSETLASALRALAGKALRPVPAERPFPVVLCDAPMDVPG